MPDEPRTYRVPTRLSPSRIGDWRKCPLAYRLKHLDGLGKHEPPQVHLVKGNFVHSVLELLLAHPRDERTTERAREAFDSAKSRYESSARFRALALDDVATANFWRHSRELVNGYYRIENPRVPDVLGLELSLETSLGPFVLHGIIDRLERAPDGTLVVSDYKTGNSKKHRTRCASTTSAAVRTITRATPASCQGPSRPSRSGRYARPPVACTARSKPERPREISLPT